VLQWIGKMVKKAKRAVVGAKQVVGMFLFLLLFLVVAYYLGKYLIFLHVQ